MIAPRVLFLTDDREHFSDGNYYLAYQRAFARHCDLTLRHPLDPTPDVKHFDLVVLGHAAIEHYARVRHAGFLPWSIRSRLWFRHDILRALRRTRTPVVLFTKNDYKHFEVKNSFIAFVRPDLVISHTRSALALLHNPAGTTRWMPFGVDTELFRPETARREFVVGFRANSNSEWNGGVRERLYRALTRLQGKRSVSLTISKDGENFLVGKPYADWIRSCLLLGNTVSAAGTVGPRFLEAIACGTVPIAPRHTYEGFLVPDRHYIPLDPGADHTFPALEEAVGRFVTDPRQQEELRANGRALVEQHTVDRHVIHVCRELGV